MSLTIKKKKTLPKYYFVEGGELPEEPTLGQNLLGAGTGMATAVGAGIASGKKPGGIALDAVSAGLNMIPGPIGKGASALLNIGRSIFNKRKAEKEAEREKQRLARLDVSNRLGKSVAADSMARMPAAVAPMYGRKGLKLVKSKYC